MKLPAFLQPAPPPNPAALLARTQRALEKLREHPDERLPGHAADLRQLARQSPMRADFVPKAVGLVAEAIRRAHGLEAYPCQLQAGLALARGALVEMATGEGKTLAALLGAFVFALHGRGAHIATVNGYLARRDAEFATAACARLGLKVGLLREGAPPAEKRQAYAADMTYGVGAEFGFDYLRDQLALRAAGRIEPRFHEVLLGREPRRPELLQRPLAFAVVDEADSVFLDEARSPLIIATGEKRPSLTPGVYRLAAQVAAGLQPGGDFLHDPHTGRWVLTERGEAAARAALTDAALAELRRLWTDYIEQALHAAHGLRRDVHYIVREGEVIIVDEYTGRLCPDRSWRGGLHQAVEALCGVEIREENTSEATITRPAYFRLYERIAGLTGTAAEAAAELRASYGLRTEIIPLHRPSQRRVLADRVFLNRTAKLAAAAEDIAARRARGQPVLVGSRTIENSEALAAVLAAAGVPFALLNAKQDAEEAAIIARAGEPGRVTIATNMAGRGAHIPVPMASQRAGGLHVLGLERHESARIDRQLIGRGARQGEPGSAQFFLALDDHLLTRHAPDLAARLARRPVDDSLASHFLRVQRKVERHDREARRQLAKYDAWINELKEAL
jgi:preprotein translocase subunit SecA